MKPTGPVRPNRRCYTLPPDLLDRLDAFRHDHRIKRESEALRVLIEAGLSVVAPRPEQATDLRPETGPKGDPGSRRRRQQD